MLKKQTPIPFGLAHISLTFVGLMWVLPFLYYYHAYPITTFYQEWGAGLLGLCALPLLLTTRYWKVPEVPRIMILPVGLMLLLMVQFLAGRITHFDHLMLMSMYFLFAALLMMLGQRLRIEFGLPALATALAVALLLGAELNTLSGVLQHYRWNTILNSVITSKVSYSVYGNTAQPNHFANYIALGLISLGLLYVRLSMRVWQVALLATPMLFVMVLSSSRSTWLYLVFVLGLAYLWQRRDKALRGLMYYSMAILAGFALMHLVVQIPWLAGVGANVTPVDRLFGSDTNGSVRLHLWREAGLIFTQFPLLGAGFGQFAFQHFQLGDELRNPSIAGLYNNAHNLVMQTAAEAGTAGLLVLLGTLCQWFWQSVVRGAKFSVYHWWGYAVLAVLGIHSLLEYPLWYAYFLGVTAIMLGIFDNTSYRLELRNVGRLSVALILMLGGLTLMQTLQGYQHLERALEMRARVFKDSSFIAGSQAELLKVNNSPLLGSYGQLYVASTMEISAENLQLKLQLNQSALRFIPISALVYHQPLLLTLADRTEEGKQQMEKAIWAYPADFRTAQRELEDLASKDPAHFSPLLEFATQKYEEYRRAAIPAN